MTSSISNVGHRLFRTGARGVLGAAGFSLLLAGCATTPSDTVLLKEIPGVPDAYRVPRENDIPYAKNVVYVPGDARFALNLEAINTGWLHQRQVTRDPSKPSPFDRSPVLAGKDLWVLVNARSLSGDDALALHAKTISRALAVKSGMRSFGLIPLSADEKNLFALEADTDYEVSLRIYEVDAVAFERIAAGYHQANPGLSGMAVDAWSTVRSMTKALVGESGLRTMHTNPGESFPVEPMLREAGAVLQFEGDFSIFRNETRLAPSKPDGTAQVLSQRFVLVDPYQRGDTDYTKPNARPAYADGKEYLARLETIETADSLSRRDAFVRFTVDAVWSPLRRARDETKLEGEALASAPEAEPSATDEEKAATAAVATRLEEATLQAYLKAAEIEKQAVLEAHETMQRTGPIAADRPPEALQTALLTASAKARESREARAAWETAKAAAEKQRQASQTASAKRVQIQVNKEAALTAGQVFEAAVREASSRIGESARAQQEMLEARRRAEAAGHAAAEKDLALATAIQARQILGSAATPDAATVTVAEKAVATAQADALNAHQLAEQKAAEAAQKASVVVDKLAEADKAEAALSEARRNKEKADSTVQQTSDQTLPIRLNVLGADGL